MKKFIMALVCLMTMVILTSCSKTLYSVTASYDVCWPDGTRTYNDTTSVKISSYTEPIVVCYSLQGTNYVSIGYNETIDLKDPNSKDVKHYISTTAPIRLINWKVVTIKESKRKAQNRCAKVLKNGERCSNMARYDSRYCWKHD